MNLVANIMTTWIGYKGFQTYALIVIDEPHEIIGPFTRAYRSNCFLPVIPSSWFAMKAGRQIALELNLNFNSLSVAV